MNKTLYIVRGIPGSGKSTFAKTLSPFHYEADMFFMEDGEYKFDVTRLHEAHMWCEKSVFDVMSKGESNVVVSNTFTTEKEMKPYLEMASRFEYKVVSLVVENRHGNKSIHDVPEEVITKMKNRFSIKL